VRLDAVEERMVVISDLHLGNPYSRAARQLPRFIEYLADGQFALCINGDGLDILQGQAAGMATEALEVFGAMRHFLLNGRRLYYVVGNHDLALERTLNSWLGEHLVPFLNLSCGSLRVRIEHGHIYDSAYALRPGLYEHIGAAAKPFLRMFPDVYELYTRIAHFQAAQRQRFSAGDDDASKTSERRAAAMLARRGFDVVVFGHTHRPERIALDHGAVYINSGNWLRSSTLVEITAAGAQLKAWTGTDVIDWC
jgi:UDP-2,3-diacylglucosamine pyrophosphatase LpxH